MDLNADIAEGFPYDLDLLRTVTSANVACGAHAGDEAHRAAALEAAAAAGVTVGAHPGYPDRAGFGRRRLAMSASALRDSLLAQVAHLQELARRLRVPGPRYLKPHGALYHAAAADAEVAAVVVAVAAASGLPHLLHAPGAATVAVAAASGVGARGRVAVHAEGFADRRYLPDGSLVPRGEPGAVLAASGQVGAQALALAARQAPPTCPTLAPPAVVSLCVHGDHPGAGVTAAHVREALAAAGHTVASFLR